MSSTKSDGKTEKLKFIINNTYYETDNIDFINYARKRFTRKAWEKLGNFGKIEKLSDYKQKKDIAHYHRLCYLGKIIKDYEEYLEKQSKLNKAYYFITINPPPNSVKNFREMDAILRRFSSLNYVKNNIEYCIEQRSNFPIMKDDIENNTIPYNGIHAHIILRKTKKPYKVKTDLIRIFKASRVLIPKFLDGKNFIKFPKGDFLEDKRRYIRGDKGDNPEKKSKVDIDKILRDIEGLPPLYSDYV